MHLVLEPDRIAGQFYPGTLVIPPEPFLSENRSCVHTTPTDRGREMETKKRDRKRDSQRGREKETEKERQKERQSERERERERKVKVLSSMSQTQKVTNQRRK